MSFVTDPEYAEENETFEVGNTDLEHLTMLIESKREIEERLEELAHDGRSVQKSSLKRLNRKIKKELIRYVSDMSGHYSREEIIAAVRAGNQ